MGDFPHATTPMPQFTLQQRCQQQLRICGHAVPLQQQSNTQFQPHQTSHSHSASSSSSLSSCASSSHSPFSSSYTPDTCSHLTPATKQSISLFRPSYRQTTYPTNSTP